MGKADSHDRPATRQAFVESVLSLMPVLPFDLQAARLHARQWAELATEKCLPWGRRLSKPLGIVLLASGLIIVLAMRSRSL